MWYLALSLVKSYRGDVIDWERSIRISNQQTGLAWIVGNHRRDIKQSINERARDGQARSCIVWRSSSAWAHDAHLLLRLR